MAAQDKGVLTSAALPSEDSTYNNNHQHQHHCHQEGTATTTTEIGGIVAGGGGGGDASVEAASEVSTIVSDDVPGGTSSSVVAAAQSATAVQLHGTEGPGGREQQQHQHQQQKEHDIEAQPHAEEQPENQAMGSFYDGGSHHEDDDEALRSHNLAAAAEVETAASLGFSTTDQLEKQHLDEDNDVGDNHHDVDMTAEDVLDAAMMCDYGGGGGKGSLNNDSDKEYGLVNHGDPTMEDGNFVDNAMPIQPHPDDEDYNPIPVLQTTPTAAAAAAAEISRTLTSGDDGDSMLHIGMLGHDFNLGGGDSLSRKRSANDYGTTSSGYESYGSNNAGGSQDYDQLLLTGESIPKKMKMTNAQTGVPTQTSYQYNSSNNHGIKTSAAAPSGTTASNPSSKKVNNEQWEAMFEKLKAYKSQNGNCLVPKRYATDPRLGTWVETQRNQRKKLKLLGTCPTTGKELFEHNNRLNAERLAKLEDIGFAWSAKHVRKNNNGKNLNGGANVAAAGSSSNLKAPAPGSQSASPSPATIPKLNAKDGNGSSGGATVVAKTKTAKGPRSSTAKAARPQQQQPQQRRPRLNETQWDDMYKRLVQYKKEHGDCLVPRKYEKDPKLAVWCEVQRSLNNQQQRNVAARTNASSPTNAPSSKSHDDQGKLLATTSSPPTAELDELSKPQSALVPAASPEVSLVDVGTNSAVESMQQYLPDDDKNKGKRLTPERKQKLDELGFVWSLRTKRVEDNWNQMFQQLVTYKEEHGDCLVPSRYEANLKLAKWVETQRQESKKATDGRSTNPRLTEERKRRLESIGFEWKVKQKMKRYYDKRWDSMFDRLVAFKQANGHCMVPKRYATDPQLGTWVHTQRIQYRTKYRKATKNVALSEEEVSALKSCGDEVTYRLTDERRQRLEDIGFVWSAREGEKGPDSGRITRNSYDDQWDSMFEQLKEYKAKFGNCLVPKRYKDNPKLGTWCDTQRVQRKKLMKKLSEKMSKTPGGSGSSEAPSETAVSRDGYESAPATTSGTSSPTNTPGSSSKPLVGRLTDERIRRLSDIGFVWEIRNDWQKHYDELKEYKKKHGHCNVPSRYAENRRLGIWVSAQRAAYKANPKATESGGGRAAPLTQERIDLLNEIGFSFSIRSRESLGESWFQRLQELKAFKEKYGHCLVPSRYTEAPGLGTWVGSQRSAYRLWKQAQANPGTVVPGSTAMNEERVKALDELGFVWVLRKKDNRNGSPTQPANYSQNQAVSQYQNDFIHENDGFSAAQVLQVLHGGGHDLDRRNSSAGFSQSSQYQEQSIAMNQYESHIQQQQPPQNAQAMVGPDSDQNVAI